MDYILIFCTINDLEKAKVISRVLVGEKLTACVNIIPKVTSIYFWNDEIVEDGEYLMIAKTKKDLFDEVKSMIIELHPYEVAEVISIDIKDGSKPYLDWIKNSVK